MLACVCTCVRACIRSCMAGSNGRNLPLACTLPHAHCFSCRCNTPDRSFVIAGCDCCVLGCSQGQETVFEWSMIQTAETDIEEEAFVFKYSRNSKEKWMRVYSKHVS